MPVVEAAWAVGLGYGSLSSRRQEYKIMDIQPEHKAIKGRFFLGENEHILNEGEMEVIVAESGLW